MKKQELDNLVSFMNNINMFKIASVYGYNFEKCPESKKYYFTNKLAIAIENPLTWLSSLDDTNRKRLSNLCTENPKDLEGID